MLNLSEQIYESGYNTGVSHGVDQTKRETAIRLILRGIMSDEDIADDVGISIENVKSLKTSLKKQDN